MEAKTMTEIETNLNLKQVPMEWSGGHLQGYIDCDYKTLKKLFGQPSDSDGYKVDAEWTVKTPAGIASIYNYKDGKNYCGASGTPKTKIRDWHIGGNDINVVAWIMAVVFQHE